MSLVDLATRQDVDSLNAKLDQLLQHTAGARATASELLTLDEVAAYTKFERRTVRRWVSAGCFNEAGKRVYLPALKYGELLRFKRAEVDAFGLGLGLLAPCLTSDQLQPTRKAKATRKAPVPSEDALKVA